MPRRIGWIDAARAIGIILVVIGHTSLTGPFRQGFYTFHVPLFFFISAFLLNVEKYAHDAWGFVRRRARRLLIPYFAAALFSFQLWNVRRSTLWTIHATSPAAALLGILRGNGVGGLAAINIPLWFLVALFVGEVIFFVLLIVVRRRHVLLQATVFLGLTITGCEVGLHHWLPWSIDVALAAQAFMFAGYRIRQLFDSGAIRPQLRWLPPLVALTGLGLVWHQQVDMNYRSYGNWILFVLCGISGSLLVVWVAAWITKIDLVARVLGYIGRNSIMILVLQFPIGFFAINVANDLYRSHPFVMRPYWWLYALCGIILPLAVAEVLRWMKSLGSVLAQQTMQSESAAGD